MRLPHPHPPPRRVPHPNLPCPTHHTPAPASHTPLRAGYSWSVIKPDNTAKKRWDGLIATLILYSIIAVPLRIGFGVCAPPGSNTRHAAARHRLPPPPLTLQQQLQLQPAAAAAKGTPRLASFLPLPRSCRSHAPTTAAGGGGPGRAGGSSFP